MPDPKDKKQQHGLPVRILLRDGSCALDLVAIGNISNQVEVVPRRDMLIGVQPGHVVTVGFGEERVTAEPETVTVGNSTGPISLISRKGKSRAGTEVKRGPFKLADSMKPFWEQQGWVKHGASGEITGYTQADWTMPLSPFAL